MGSVTWRESGVVDATPERVYAWLTDFSEDDHGSEAYRRGAGVPPGKKRKPAKREVLSRDGNVLRIRDRWDGNDFTSTVTLDPARLAVRIVGSFGYEATWTATAEGGGTRVSVEGSMGKGIVGSAMKLFQGKMRKSMGSDFRGHLEDLRESLKSGKP